MTAETINLAAGVIFLGGLVLAVLLTGGRMVYYRTHGRKQPRLLRRDLIVKGSMAVTILLIIGGRIVGLSEEVRTSVEWALITDIPAIVSILTYLYYEIFVIERGRDSNGR